MRFSHSGLDFGAPFEVNGQSLRRLSLSEISCDYITIQINKEVGIILNEWNLRRFEDRMTDIWAALVM